MTIGYSSFGKCFATSSDAIDNHYSNIQPSVYWNTYYNQSYLIVPLKVSGVWNYSYFTNNGALAISSSAPTNVYGSCTLEDEPYNYVDAAAAWTFAFIWVLTLWFIAKNAGIIVNAIRKF